MIQSIVRSGRINSGGKDGNLLKAQSGGEPGCDRRLQPEISVDFTGTDASDPRTVFYITKSKEKEANVLMYSVKDARYYLAVNKSGKVKLRKLKNFPQNKKYFFYIERIGREFESPVTFKSLKTEEYLHCDEDGKAFMKKTTTNSNGEPKDRQTWFSLNPKKYTQVVKQEQHMLFASNRTWIEIIEEEIIREDMEDGKSEASEDSGRGNSEILEPEEGYDKHPELTVYVSTV